MSTTWLILLSLGGLIIFGLAGYAGYLLTLLHAQKQAQAAQQRVLQQQQTEQLQAHNRKLEQDIQFIASATLAGQCELTEAVMRIAVLFSRFAAVGASLPDFNQQYAAIFALYDKVKHYPTHEKYAALEKQARMKLRVERMQLEAEWQARVTADLNRLVAKASLIS